MNARTILFTGCFGSLLTLGGVPRAALAQSTDPASEPPATTEQTEAQRLYNEGRTSFDAGDYAKACSLFEQSYSLSGSAGALLSRADCEEKRGNLEIAYDLWKQGQALLVREPDRASFAETRATALEARLVSVDVVLPANATGLVLELDGVRLDVTRSPFRVQPGKHVFKAVAPSGEAEEEAVEAVLGTPLRIELLENLKVDPGVQPRAVEPGISPLGIAGWSLLGVGAASLIGFGVTSGLFLGECGSLSTCEVPKADVEGLGIANIVLLVAGGVLGATGGALLIVDATMGVTVTSDQASFYFSARF